MAAVEEAPGKSNADEPCSAIKKDGTVCGSRFNVKDGVCLAHRTNVGRKPRAESESGEAPPTPKPPPRLAAAPKRGSLENELREKYIMLAGGITLADEDLGAWTASKAASLAHAHAQLAQENAAVDKFLRSMMTGGVTVYALVETALWIFGLYSIAALKAGRLPQKTANAAVMFGVPLMEVNMKMQAEREAASEPPPAEDEAA